jgi:hypothetical protein
MNQEYTDANTALEIYKEQEKRYISMIATADESYALQLEQNLSELEVKIAQLESQIKTIETDVAYSYIDITIREVEKYSLHDNTNTFTMRMKDNFSGSWDAFLGFLESILTFIIYAWYYIVILIAIIIFISKHTKKKSKIKKEDKPIRTYDLNVDTKESDGEDKDVLQ